MTYIKEGSKTFKVTQNRQEVDVASIKLSLQSWEQMESPSKNELIELGKSHHPYYQSRDSEIAYLRQQISEVEG